MKKKRIGTYKARARSDPSLLVGGKGGPQEVYALRIDPPPLFGSRGHPPEVWKIIDGPPVDYTLSIRCLKVTAKDRALIDRKSKFEVNYSLLPISRDRLSALADGGVNERRSRNNPDMHRDGMTEKGSESGKEVEPGGIEEV